MLVSPAGRDDTDDFLAIDFLPVDVDHEKHSSLACVDRHGANGVPSLFACFVDAIGPYEAVLVFKREGGHLERDTVLLLVEPILRLIPFVAHLYIQA
jgi:hypothetical protein